MPSRQESNRPSRTPAETGGPRRSEANPGGPNEADSRVRSEANGGLRGMSGLCGPKVDHGPRRAAQWAAKGRCAERTQWRHRAMSEIRRLTSIAESCRRAGRALPDKTGGIIPALLDGG